MKSPFKSLSWFLLELLNLKSKAVCYKVCLKSNNKSKTINVKQFSILSNKWTNALTSEGNFTFWILTESFKSLWMSDSKTKDKKSQLIRNQSKLASQFLCEADSYRIWSLAKRVSTTGPSTYSG